MKKTFYSAALAALIGLGCQAAASAQETILGLTDNNEIVSIQSTSPDATSTAVGVTGLVANDDLVGIDFRAGTGEIYAIGRANNVYTLDFGSPTFAATLVGNFADGINDDASNLGPLVGESFAFDFNPVLANGSDPGGSFARIIGNDATTPGNDNTNRVINGNTGEYLGGAKTNVFYFNGDAENPTPDSNAGANPNIQGIAYTNSDFGASTTQQFGIDVDQNVLVTVANNAGTLNTVTGLGFNASGEVGFDISGVTETGYAAFQTGTNGASQLFTIDLNTNAVTPIANFGSQGSIIRSLAVVGAAVPEPGSLGLLAIGAAALAVRRRRK